MRVWAIDPGAVATGLAWLNFTDQHDEMQYDDPIKVFRHIDLWAVTGDTILIEDYSHGGTFTVEAKTTLKVIGYLEYALHSQDRFKVLLRHKDKRLSGQSEAAKLMWSEVGKLKKDPERKDAFSALAHCVTYRREVA